MELSAFRKKASMSNHGLLYLNGPTLSILKKKIVDQILKRSFA